MSLDPDIDSDYLMDAVVVKLPAVLERLAQIRARGTGILTKKAISDLQQRVAQMAESNSAEVQRTAATAGELERLSVMLQSEVARFSVKVPDG